MSLYYLRPGVDDILFGNHCQNSKNLRVTLPITPFLSKQLLELSQCDNPAFDRGPVWDGLATEVISHSNILTLLLFHTLVSVEQRGGKKLAVSKSNLITAFK